MRKRTSIIASIMTALWVLPLWPAGAGSLVPLRRPVPTPAPSVNATTPQLIDAAERSGEISPDVANLYRAYALAGSARLPERFRSVRPWSGTLTLLQLSDTAGKIQDQAIRREVQSLILSHGQLQPTASRCSTSAGPMTHTLQTEHFYIEYNDAVLLATADGLEIDDYAASLEGAWGKAIGEFGWAAPPKGQVLPPGGKYHVRIDSLGPGLYGYVSSGGAFAGQVGDNPNTSWNDGDATASCMVLNDDYTTFFLFGSVPQAALDSTTAHEFNHSIQFGIGALAGPNVPDPVFIEGGATWIEDEVFDGANDNYNFLWPVFTQSMGAYTGSPYAYWITFRGITERFGTGSAGAGEQVMQDFWEITSKNTGSNLTALNMALANKGTDLASAYHAYAIAMSTLKACGGGYVLPYCFEEADGYKSTAGTPAATGSIAAVGGSYSGTVQDHYALNWVALPIGSSYTVQLTRGALGGSFNATLVCDTGSGLTLSTLATGLTTTSPVSSAFNGVGCSRAVAVITNTGHSVPNPGSSPARAYSLTTSS